jgi:hypothetical protein
VTVIKASLTTLIEVWQRRHEPESYDLVRTVRIAQDLEADPGSLDVFLALAFRVVQSTHEAAGWETPRGLQLPQCSRAAASIRESCSRLGDSVAAELHGSAGDVVLMGALGASQSLFGCWDVLPAQGEVLVRLGDRTTKPSLTVPLAQNGVQWAGVGELGDVLESMTNATELAGQPVRVPRPELYLAHAHGVPSDPDELNALIFCAAAYAVKTTGQWDAALALSKELGNGRTPVEIAMRLGVTDWLGLSVGPITRLSVTFKNLLGHSRQMSLLPLI